jgi:alpha-tubulin suppressor-like RCC1 family protein
MLHGSRVECWGDNYSAQLGLGTSDGPETCGHPPFACSSTPVSVTLSSAKLVAVGSTSVYVVRANGRVEAWGSGWFGDGSTKADSAPLDVSGLADVTQLTNSSGTGAETCIVQADGGIACWGDNFSGDLGNGMSTGPDTCGAADCSVTPVTVQSITSATQVSAGNSLACAILRRGQVACWGDDLDGELGIGTLKGLETCGQFPCSPTPVTVKEATGATEVSAASGFACALLVSKSVACWGHDVLGELGDGNQPSIETCSVKSLPWSVPCSTSPTLVSGLNSPIQVTAGGDHACALLSNQHIECWGLNDHGQLGDGTSSGPSRCSYNGRDLLLLDNVSRGYSKGTYACSRTPVRVRGISNAIEVSAGSDFTCAVLATGGAECWGDNAFGELGDGNTRDSDLPVTVK